MFAPLLLSALLVAVVVPASAADENSGRSLSSVGGNITTPASGVDDVSCVFCSVDVRGDVRGSVSVVFGNLTIEPGQSVHEEVSVVGGDLTLRRDAQIGGDMSLVAGELHQEPGASIRGDQSSLSSRWWLLIFAVPFLLLAGVIWLIVWLVRLQRGPRARPHTL
ncbi:MAG TPA: hypothetical protein VGC07_07745 [Granulicella sp.]